MTVLFCLWTKSAKLILNDHLAPDPSGSDDSHKSIVFPQRSAWESGRGLSSVLGDLGSTSLGQDHYTRFPLPHPKALSFIDIKDSKKLER